MLRTEQLASLLTELDEMEEGTVIDMMIETENDLSKYETLAVQSDFVHF